MKFSLTNPYSYVFEVSKVFNAVDSGSQDFLSLYPGASLIKNTFLTLLNYSSLMDITEQ
jgi:hypothetical protein